MKKTIFLKASHTTGDVLRLFLIRPLVDPATESEIIYLDKDFTDFNLPTSFNSYDHKTVLEIIHEIPGCQIVDDTILLNGEIVFAYQALRCITIVDERNVYGHDNQISIVVKESLISKVFVYGKRFTKARVKSLLDYHRKIISLDSYSPKVPLLLKKGISFYYFANAAENILKADVTKRQCIIKIGYSTFVVVDKISFQPYKS